jgi:hypothetical protein
MPKPRRVPRIGAGGTTIYSNADNDPEVKRLGRIVRSWSTKLNSIERQIQRNDDNILEAQAFNRSTRALFRRAEELDLRRANANEQLARSTSAYWNRFNKIRRELGEI